jgi:hypothetical protein
MNSRKVLIISDCPSDPPIAGNRNCIKENAELLKELGFDVYFLFIYDTYTSKQDLKSMADAWGNHLYLYATPIVQKLAQKICAKVCVSLRLNFPSLDLYCPAGISKYVRKICKKIDIDNVIINYIWLSKILKQINVKNKVIYTHDVFSFKNEKGNSQWFSFTPNKESEALRRSNHILAIQENEAIYYRYLCPGYDVKSVFMAFHYNLAECKTRQHNLLFFSGNNEHNIHGIRTFINSVFPHIINKYKDAKLIIGGSISKQLQYLEGQNNIEIVGSVENPIDFYKLGDIAINPVFEGTGFKVKTFEAVSYGKLVLAHQHSLEGIFEREKAPVYECNTPEDYLNVLDKVWNGIYNYKSTESNCESYIQSMNSYIKNIYKQILEN